jgi:hypothetical protein
MSARRTLRAGACALLLGLAFLLPAGGAELAYRFTLVDAAAGQRLPPGMLAVSADGQELPLQVDGQHAVARAPKPPASLEVRIRAAAPYGPREFTILGQGVRQRRTLELWVERQPANFSKSYLLSGISRLDNSEIDKGLALFEYAFRNDPMRARSRVLDDYEAMLRYNYARGLQQACLVLWYDTCAEAATRMRAILDDMKERQNAEIYRRNRVPAEMVTRALADLQAREVSARYAAALDSIGAGRLDDAKVQLQELAADAERDRAIYQANGLTRERLAADLSFVSTRMAEKR